MIRFTCAHQPGFNKQRLQNIGLCGYLSHLDVSSVTSGTPEATKERHIIRQAQLGAMLRHTEAVARVRFTCELPGLGDVTCKPFVTSLLVDTKERW